MENINTGQNRRRFVAIGFGTAVLLTITKLFRLPVNKSKPKQTAKMLAQDGSLVEVDIDHIKSRQGKISNKEMQQWIRKQ